MTKQLCTSKQLCTNTLLNKQEHGNQNHSSFYATEIYIIQTSVTGQVEVTTKQSSKSSWDCHIQRYFLLSVNVDWSMLCTYKSETFYLFTV